MRDLLTRGRLAEHPLWARALSAPELHARAILPIVLCGARGGAAVGAARGRLAAIARGHAESGAALLIPSGMLEGAVRALRVAVGDAGRPDLPVAGIAKLESALYALHRHAVGSVPISE